MFLIFQLIINNLPPPIRADDISRIISAFVIVEKFLIFFKNYKENIIHLQVTSIIVLCNLIE